MKIFLAISLCLTSTLAFAKTVEKKATNSRSIATSESFFDCKSKKHYQSLKVTVELKGDTSSAEVDHSGKTGESTKYTGVKHLRDGFLNYIHTKNGLYIVNDENNTATFINIKKGELVEVISDFNCTAG